MPGLRFSPLLLAAPLPPCPAASVRKESADIDMIKKGSPAGPITVPLWMKRPTCRTPSEHELGAPPARPPSWAPPRLPP